MKLDNIVIVLGKRLVNNRLTSEGITRVEALSCRTASLPIERTVIVFCGGVTQGQSVSEAEAMYAYFRTLNADSVNPFPERHILLETESLNTFQNMRYVSQVLCKSGLFELWSGHPVEVILLSNDYHLERIIDIQNLMDEQGLLRVLKSDCESMGVTLNIPLDISKHISVPYPHKGLMAETFLLLDELTTYRVYLEGVVNRAFDRPLDDVRCLPETLALHALSLLEALNLPVEIQDKLKSMKEVVLTTTSEFDCHAIESRLTYFHQTLMWLALGS